MSRQLRRSAALASVLVSITTAHHALAADDVSLREETAPIHDVRACFEPRYRISRIHLEPEGTTLEPAVTPEGTSAIVPRLDIHAMVVGKLTAAGR